MSRMLPVLVILGSLSAALDAQAPPAVPPDAAAYTVAYIDVDPALRREAIAAFKRYRDASRKDAGFVRLDVFEQIDRSAHFSVVEWWSDAKAREAHAAAPHTAALQETMKRVGLSGYDQRPHQTLSVAPARAGGGQTIHVVTHVDTIPTPGSDGPGLLRRLAEASRAEAGNLRFDVLQHPMRRNHFTLVEAWTNQAAVAAHALATHTKQYRAEVMPLTGSPLDERLFKAID
jgi:quinol monooxygenase YgiN